MSDVIEADAEVIEGSEELSVTYTPSVITANFDDLEARVRAMVADFEGAEYDLTDQSAIRDAKRHRTYLNGIAKQIEERRKAVKREYMRPYEDFDKRAREVAKIATDVADGIKAQLDEAEENRKAAKLGELRGHYEEFAGLLAPVVPYERLHDPKWLNKGCATNKAFAELDEKVEKLASDWESLKSAFGGTEYYDVAERELFSTMDLGSAIAAAQTAKTQAERIAALKEAMERPVEHEPAPMPEPTPAEVVESLNEAQEAVYDYVIETRCTSRQAHAIAMHLKSIGLTGMIHTR